jgi:peptide/nickel transport system permease protein
MIPVASSASVVAAVTAWILAARHVPREIARMLRAVVRRATAGAGVVAGVVILTFALLHAAPGDPVERLLGPTATPEQIAAQRRALGLDRPLAAQLVDWVRRTAGGDWGTSIATGQPVRAMLADAWPPTVRLIALSLVLSYLAAIVIGVVQAARARSRVDTVLSVATVTLFAMPGYWLGLMLVMVFTYSLGWFPAFGAQGLDADYLTGWDRVADQLRHLALPLATLVLIGAGGTARYVRGAKLDFATQPFVIAARARGLSGTRLMRRHVLRNALIPVLTLLGLSLPALFSGAVFVEAVFAWPGVGRVLVEAVRARDYPVVMAATTVSAVLVVLGNLLADLLASWADPRLRGRAVRPA